MNLRGRRMRLHNVRMQVLESCAKHRVDCLAHVRSLSEEPCAQGEACAAGSTHRKGRQVRGRCSPSRRCSDSVRRSAASVAEQRSLAQFRPRALVVGSQKVLRRTSIQLQN